MSSGGAVAEDTWPAARRRSRRRGGAVEGVEGEGGLDGRFSVRRRVRVKVRRGGGRKRVGLERRVRVVGRRRAVGRRAAVQRANIVGEVDGGGGGGGWLGVEGWGDAAGQWTGITSISREGNGGEYHSGVGCAKDVEVTISPRILKRL